jgi:hypothetical protein
MLITIFGACIFTSADGPGIIRVQVRFMGIPIPNAEIWDQYEDERYGYTFYVQGQYIFYIPIGPKFLSDPLPETESRDVEVNVKTNFFSSQSKMVYKLHGSEEVWMNFTYDLRPRSKFFNNDWLQNHHLLIFFKRLLIW